MPCNFHPIQMASCCASGPGKKVAEIECVEILLLADPAAFIDNFAMHQRDLSRRPAKAETTNARRNTDQFKKIGKFRRFRHQSVQYLSSRKCRMEKATLGLAPDREVALSRLFHV
jgi:hypothetical protein